jgi:hypothetical protein
MTPLFFVENDYGRLGREFMALDRDNNSRADIIRQIRSGGIKPVKIIEVTEPCEDFPQGRVIDVTAELMGESEQPRDIPGFEDLRRQLEDLRIDKRRDLVKEGLHGW